MMSSINRAITGEKSSIIPPPRGDLSIILFTGPKIGSVRLYIILPNAEYLEFGIHHINTLTIIIMYSSLKNTLMASVSNPLIAHLQSSYFP